MTTIFKYPLKIKDRQTIEMPSDAVILSVQLQDEIPCIWAVVNDEAPKVEKVFLVIGTGNPMPANPKVYIGTFQRGSYVWHLFEVLKQ